MTIDEAIKKRIAEIEADDRYISGINKPATIDINAPLALIQLSLETEIKSLKWVLSLITKE
jgi:hypothetical protein